MQNRFRKIVFVLAWVVLPLGVWIYANLNPNAPSCLTTQHSDLNYHAGCLVMLQDKILIIKQRFRDVYSVPSGTFNESDGDSACTAHRETFEESYVDVLVGDEFLRFPDRKFILFNCDPIIRKFDGSYEKITKASDLEDMIKRNNFKSLEVGSVEMVDFDKFTALTDYRFKDQHIAIIDKVNAMRSDTIK